MEQALYELPEGWAWTDVVELAFVKGGKRLPKGKKLQDSPTKHPYIRVADFTDTGGIKTKGLKYITGDIYETIKRYTITHRDLYISIAGTIGKTGVIPSELDGANLTENAAKLVFKNNQRQDLFFIYYFTLSSNFVAQSGIATKTVAQPKLALTRLGKIKIPLPPLNEQKRIVARLDALFTRIDTAITHLQQTLELTKALFASALDEAFDTDDHSGVSLEEVVKLVSGQHLKKGEYTDVKIPGSIPYLTGPAEFGDINPDPSRWTNVRRSIAISGDTLITVKGSGVGKVNMMFDSEIAISRQLMAARSKGQLDKSYLHLFFQARQQVFADKKTGAAIPGIGRRDVLEQVIPIPSFDEQHRIVVHLEQLSESTRALEAATQEKLGDLTRLKASLLDAAFKGQL